MCAIMKNTLIFILLFFITSCKVNQEIATTTPSPTVAPPEQGSPPTAAKPVKKISWQNELKSAFRAHYKTMVQKEQANISQNYPVIIQDFLNMTLIRSNGERVRFKMKKKAYQTLAHATHPPTSVYLLLSAADFKINKDSIIQQLMGYDTLIQKAITGIQSVKHLEKEQIENTKKMLALTHDYLQRIISERATSEAAYQDFALSVRPLTNKNLYDAAKTHLNQFKEQMQVWKTTFPGENWQELRVAVLGFHQPRIGYVPTQFFQWLLKESAFENKVAYVEFQYSIFGPNRPKAEAYALKLLTKIKLDKVVAFSVLGDEILLQQDVMAPVTKEIISNWEASNWNNQEN